MPSTLVLCYGGGSSCINKGIEGTGDRFISVTVAMISFSAITTSIAPFTLNMSWLSINRAAFGDQKQNEGAK
jgi:hypothetical protein